MKDSMCPQWTHFLHSKGEYANCSAICGHKLNLKRGSPNIYMNDCSNVPCEQPIFEMIIKQYHSV